MKEHTIKLGGKTFPLLFTLGTLERMEETIEGFDLQNVDEVLKKTKGLLDILYLLAEQGAIVKGEKLQEDRAWFGAHAPASRTWIVNAYVTIVDTLADGMTMETDDGNENEEVDVVLQDIKKKDGKTD